MQMTSAYANKLLKSLEEEKNYWLNRENMASSYVAAINEEPVIPAYDYREVTEKIREINEKAAIIKHALNTMNVTAKVLVGKEEMSIDTILVRMAQMNRRRERLDFMRKQLPKAREGRTSFVSKNVVPEYRYINYDLEEVKRDYEIVTAEIMEMQMALDRHNQTELFEVAI